MSSLRLPLSELERAEGERCEQSKHHRAIKKEKACFHFECFEKTNLRLREHEIEANEQNE